MLPPNWRANASAAVDFPAKSGPSSTTIMRFLIRRWLFPRADSRPRPSRASLARRLGRCNTQGGSMSLVVEESTLDDLLFASVQYLLSAGESVSTSRGETLETRGARLQLSNPRARVSRTSALPHMFSALAETIWYLTGDDSLDHISFYVSGYKGLIGEGTGVYGPRLFGTGDYAQIQRVVQQLTVGSTTRQAVVELFERRDLDADPRDVPCTCTLQFLLRGGRVDLIPAAARRAEPQGAIPPLSCQRPVVACRGGVRVRASPRRSGRGTAAATAALRSSTASPIFPNTLSSATTR
ncbi:hypothetical protein FF38_05448 [Lucilia cuprina]|uniref:Thymidylate synthase/dCMP hydroxymethylase domain-containing protein n=1 Tax=Lucilia cuprina TaxID=7375 RepID=A0A0L0BL16_LUCCU|nr:hypothetical protein FF38_05448 [Lucilia cuprina]